MMKRPVTANSQSARIGAITDAERAAAARAYAEYTADCAKLGCQAEPFDCYLPEWIEVARATADEPIDAGASELSRDYERQFAGLGGFSIDWIR
jgi:hypothetical protein